MQIVIEKDGTGFLAQAKKYPHIFAWGENKSEAKSELANVIDMMMDYHLEQVEIERKLRSSLQNNKISYAI
jgi:hypothetical protein